MSAGTFNIAIERGTTLNIPLTWYDVEPSGSNPGSVVDLTGCTARMQVRQSIPSEVILTEFTTENGGLVIEPTAGIIHIKASATQTSAYSFSSGVYDLEIVFPDDTVKRLLQGNVTVDQEVTR